MPAPQPRTLAAALPRRAAAARGAVTVGVAAARPVPAGSAGADCRHGASSQSVGSPACSPGCGRCAACISWACRPGPGPLLVRLWLSFLLCLAYLNTHPGQLCRSAYHSRSLGICKLLALLLYNALCAAVKLCYGVDGTARGMKGLPPSPAWGDWAPRQLCRFSSLSAFPLSLDEVS